MTTPDRLTDTVAPAAQPDAVTIRQLLRRPATVAWVVLVLATLVSWWLGDGHGAARTSTVIVLAVAFGKVFLVGHYFMELRSAPLPLRLVFSAWVVLVGGTLILMYLSSG